MVTGDAFKTDIHALLEHMDADTRFSVDDRAALVAYHTKINAGTTTTRPEDMLFVQCLKSWLCQDENYA